MSRKTDSDLNKGRTLLYFISLVCFGLLVLLLIFAGGAGKQAYAESARFAVQNTTVQVAPIQIAASFERPRIVYGQVESAQQSDIGFELSGILLDLLVSEGAAVKEGQPLARLDLARLDAQENELTAALNRAKADAKLAKLSMGRVTELVRAKLEPQQRLDEASAAYEAAQALVNEVDARLASLQVEKQKSILLAPFDGQVLSQLIDLGTVVSAGQAVFRLIASSELEARFGLPEKLAFGLQIGEQRVIKLGETSFLGTIKSIAQQRNQATRTIETVMTINRDDLSARQLSAIVSGDLVSIEVALTIDRKGAWIPTSALANGVRGLWTVLVYDASEKTLSSRLVSVEYIDQQRAFVSGAIQQGEQIVVSGAHRFTPGQTVANVNYIEMFEFASTANKGS